MLKRSTKRTITKFKTVATLTHRELHAINHQPSSQDALEFLRKSPKVPLIAQMNVTCTETCVLLETKKSANEAVQTIPWLKMPYVDIIEVYRFTASPRALVMSVVHRAQNTFAYEGLNFRSRTERDKYVNCLLLISSNLASKEMNTSGLITDQNEKRSSPTGLYTDDALLMTPAANNTLRVDHQVNVRSIYDTTGLFDQSYIVNREAYQLAYFKSDQRMLDPTDWIVCYVVRLISHINLGPKSDTTYEEKYELIKECQYKKSCCKYQLKSYSNRFIIRPLGYESPDLAYPKVHYSNVIRAIEFTHDIQKPVVLLVVNRQDRIYHLVIQVELREDLEEITDMIKQYQAQKSSGMTRSSRASSETSHGETSNMWEHEIGGFGGESDDEGEESSGASDEDANNGIFDGVSNNNYRYYEKNNSGFRDEERLQAVMKKRG
ncbi:unnamed protein product [Protopolystoma xenopodis]|uniref:Uncharacterized protein n=1 Tax=Protopolystoma xenopodis TaxID=117903 RepID=A0A448XAW1_9PLAT|nr:unnamed protein product [Protopolystoma xenopodis]